MSFLRRFLRPPNSLILAYDHLDYDAGETMARQIADVKQYYQLAKLSEIVEALHAGQAQGMAAVVFKSSRKSLFLHGVKHLRPDDVPVTVFVHGEWLGTNRLPPVEELALYRKHYPDRLTEAQLREWTERAWREPEAVRGFVDACRREIGPFPLNQLDPTTFFSTWGNLQEFPPEAIEIGLTLRAHPTAKLADELAFVRQLTRQKVSLAFAERPVDDAPGTLGALGLRGLLGTGTGAVEKTTSPWNLPQWSFDDGPKEER